MTHLANLINELDLTLDLLTKSDKWDRLYKDLQGLLKAKIEEQYKDIIADILKFVAENKELSDNALDDITKLIEKGLGSSIADKLDEPVGRYLIEAYKNGKREPIKSEVRFSFNNADKKALRWLKKDFTYWIENYYDNNLKETMRKGVKEILSQGLSYNDAGTELKNMLNGRFGKSKSYWEGLANHIITRSRSFGTVSGLVAAGAKYYRYVAVLDHRTSKICMALHNRVFEVKQAVKLRDKLLSAKDPEKVKDISPWLTDKQVEKRVVGKLTIKLNDGLVLPPQHFNCRSIIQVANEAEFAKDANDLHELD